MDACLPRALLRCCGEASVLHAERIQYVVAKIDIERLAAGCFDDPTTQSMLNRTANDHRDRNASGVRRAAILPGRVEVHPVLLLRSAANWRPKPIGEACEKMSQGDRSFSGPQLRGT